MPSSSHHAATADPHLVKPGDIVWLHNKHLTSTRGGPAHTWPHFAVYLFPLNPDGSFANAIVSGVTFHFACISSVTRNRPFQSSRQVLLHPHANNGLKDLSAVCVDFAAEVAVTIESGRHVLDGVRRLTDPVVWRVPASPTLQAIVSLFAKYWTQVAGGESPEARPD